MECVKEKNTGTIYHIIDWDEWNDGILIENTETKAREKLKQVTFYRRFNVLDDVLSLEDQLKVALQALEEIQGWDIASEPKNIAMEALNKIKNFQAPKQ